MDREDKDRHNEDGGEGNNNAAGDTAWVAGPAEDNREDVVCEDAIDDEELEIHWSFLTPQSTPTPPGLGW